MHWGGTLFFNEMVLMNEKTVLKNSLFKQPHYKVLFSIFIGLSLACEGKKVAKKSGLGTPADYQGGIEGYYLSDQACLDSGTGQVVSTYLYRMWNGSEVGVYKYTNQNSTVSSSLSSEVISETVINLHESSSVCLDQDSSGLCVEGTKVLSKPVLLPVCQDAYLYPRQSVEGVAISSAMSINRSFEFYKSLDSNALPKVSLVVLPILEKSYMSRGQVVRSDFELNNLAYVESFLQKPAFVILPTSRDRQPFEDLSTLNLWESSWTLGHELGHHILATVSGVNKSALLVKTDESILTRNFLTSFGFSLIPFNSIYQGVGFHDFGNWLFMDNDSIMNTRSLQSVRSVGNIDIWSGINEGFSDLFATAASSGGDLTRGVPCIAVSRNPDIGYFLTGEPKVLDAATLQQFHSTVSLSQSLNCSAPWFQGPHSIGAVIAHGLRKLSTLQGQNSIEFGRSLMLWAKSMGDMVRSTTTLSLSDLTWEGIRSVIKSPTRNVRLNLEQCQVIYQVFPVWFQNWQSTGTLTCQ
jgi:hypothetical protein